ncbi:MAG: hypothetical protein QM692_15790 [Thermomicrobiales bacterium]
MGDTIVGAGSSGCVPAERPEDFESYLQVLATLPPSPRFLHPIAPYTEPLRAWDSTRNPPRTDLLAEPFVQDDGCIQVPHGPGQGIGVDEDVVRRYLRGEWTVA